jgi:hypothetical protein
MVNTMLYQPGSCIEMNGYSGEYAQDMSNYTHMV